MPLKTPSELAEDRIARMTKSLTETKIDFSADVDEIKDDGNPHATYTDACHADLREILADAGRNEGKALKQDPVDA